MKTKLTSLTLAAACLVLLCATPATLSAATITVTNTADSGPGTMRAAVANSVSGGTIAFDPSLSGASILLTSGQITLNQNLTIDASALAGGLVISGNANSRVFQILPAATVTLNSLSLVSGSVSNDSGGAILNSGTLTALNCRFTNNVARGGAGQTPGSTSSGGGGGGGAGLGGAIFSDGAGLTLTNCAFTGNCVFGGNGGNGVGNTGNWCVGGNGGGPNGGGGGAGGVSGTNGLYGGGGGGGSSTGWIGYGGGAGGFGGGGGGGGALYYATTGNGGPGGAGGTSAGVGAMGSKLGSGGGGGGAGLGGAVFAETGAIDVVNCTFTANLATNGLGGASPGNDSQPGQGAGGALFSATTNVLVQDNVFSGNIASSFAPDILSPFVVYSLADNGPGSLRQVLTFAGNGGIITFAVSGTITLTSGQITLNQNLTIDASALPNGISINGNNASRVFEVSDATVVLNSLTITNGEHNNDNDYGGGGIFIYSGNLTLNNCTVAGNSANHSWGGGGIFNCPGNLTLNNCTLSGNSANNSYVGGGGIFNYGTVTLNQCTLSGNSATDCYSVNGSPGGGGGIGNYSGTVTVNQCTLSGNSANNSFGGGGGGILDWDTLTLYNSIVAGNSPDNLFGWGLTTSTGVNLTSGDPLLAPLGNYGGPTQTMPPLPGSPAIDRCTNGTIFTTDQRGFPRVVGPFADIGACELPYVSVTNTADSGPGSLRAAVANSASGGTIAFATNLSGQTITLTSGDLLLNQNLTIDASALSNGISINGNNASRVFEVSNATLVLNSLTITNGEDNNDQNFPSGGGGIFICSGNLTLNNCTVAGNSANHSWGGGGILNSSGNLTLNNCTVAGNSANHSAGGGGGIYNGDGTVTLNLCTLAGNSATNCYNANGGDGGGGGIFNDGGTVTVNQSTLTGNSANNSSGGGGIFNNSGNLTVNQCTLSGNSANNCWDGGILNFDTLTLYNSIVAGNVPDNLSVYDDFDDLTGVNLTSGDPLLAPLGNYGGPTQTMPPLPGSPAIDGCTNGTTFTTDQRGFPRVVGPFADIGAVESGNPIPGFTPVVTVNGDVVNPIGVGGVSLRETIAFATYNTTITFGPALSGATIVLTNGQLNVPNSITILGPGSDVLTVSGNHTSRVFNITGTEVTLSGLTIANGNTSLIGAGLYAGGGPGSVVNLTGCVVTNNFTTASGGGIYNDLNVAMTLSNCVITGNSVSGWGGGILNNGTPGQSAVLNLISSTVSNNSAYGGGGIDNLGSLTTTDCAISSNSAATWGGGIYNYQATLTVNTTTFSGNSADGEGGGIDNCGAWSGSARLNVSGSTFRGNTAGTDGGGIRNDGENNGNATATIGFCTLSNNVAGGAGGGIANDGGSAGAATLTVSNCTISSNSASVSGGGIFSDGESGGYASLTVSNSTLNSNAAAIWGGGIYNLGQKGGNASLAVWRSTLSGNLASGRGGGIDNDGYSQGQATTTLGTSTLSGNSAGQGGGIYNDGYASSNAAVTIKASTMSGNSATNGGGGIYNEGEDAGNATALIGDTILNATQAQTVVLSENFDSEPPGSFGSTYNYASGGNVTSTIVAPGAGGSGQALQLSGNLTSGVSENAGVNSPIYTPAGNLSANLSDYTLSFDMAISHGANSGFSVVLNIFGTAQADGSSYTVPINQITVGGGFQHFSVNLGTLPPGYLIPVLNPTDNQYSFQLLFLGTPGVAATPETVLLDNLQITMGVAGGNVYNYSGTIISDGYNLSSDNSGSSFLNQTGDQNNTYPKLGPFQNNGGPTLTMLPLFGSPAIDAGNDSVTNSLATDQRGYPRLSGAHVDIGAVEAQWAPGNHPPLLTNPTGTAPGGVPCFQGAFSSATNADFTVLATTNLALPLADWTVLAPATQCSPGQYQFTDPGATNYPRRFYQVISP